MRPQVKWWELPEYHLFALGKIGIKAKIRIEFSNRGVAQFDPANRIRDDRPHRQIGQLLKDLIGKHLPTAA